MLGLNSVKIEGGASIQYLEYSLRLRAESYRNANALARRREENDDEGIRRLLHVVL